MASKCSRIASTAGRRLSTLELRLIVPKLQGKAKQYFNDNHIDLNGAYGDSEAYHMLLLDVLHCLLNRNLSVVSNFQRLDIIPAIVIHPS